MRARSTVAAPARSWWRTGHVSGDLGVREFAVSRAEIWSTLVDEVGAGAEVADCSVARSKASALASSTRPRRPGLMTWRAQELRADGTPAEEEQRGHRVDDGATVAAGDDPYCDVEGEGQQSREVQL